MGIRKSDENGTNDLLHLHNLSIFFAFLHRYKSFKYIHLNCNRK